MFLAFQLALKDLLRAPVRTILTLLAVIAASTITAWMVSSYDKTLSSLRDDSPAVRGAFDALVIAGEPGFLSDALTASLAQYQTQFFSVQRCTVSRSQSDTALSRGPGPSMGGGGRRRGGMRGGRGGMGSSEAGAPPSFGLPVQHLSVIGTEAKVAPMALEDGHWLPLPYRETPVINGVADAQLARTLKLKVGDEIYVGSYAGKYTVRILGIVRDNAPVRKYQTHVASEIVAPPNYALYVAPRDAERIYGGSLRAGYALVKDAQAAVWTAQKAFREELKNAKAYCVTQDEAVKMMAAAPDDLQMRAKAYAAAGVSLIVSFFIILTTLSMGVSERIKQFALLRMVAFKRVHIMMMILSEAIVFGLIGWGGGLFSGAILLSVIEKAPERGVVAGWEIGFWTVILCGACSLLGALAAAVWPMIRAARIRPLQAFRDEQRRTRQRPLRLKMALCGVVLIVINPLIVAWPDLGDRVRVELYGWIGCPALAIGFVLIVPALLAGVTTLFSGVVARLMGLNGAFLRSQIRGNFWRCTGSAVALSVGLGLYMNVLIWSDSMLQPYLPGAWLPDEFASVLVAGIAPEEVDKLENCPLIREKRVLPVAVEQTRLVEDLTQSAAFQSVVRQNNVVFCGLDPEKGYDNFNGADPMLDFTFVQGSRAEAVKLLASGQNYCLIPDHFARITGLNNGDTFLIIPPSEPDCEVAFCVAGVIELKGWHWFSKFSGTRRNTGRTAAMIFCAYNDAAQVFNFHRVNYLWFDTVLQADEKTLEAAITAAASADLDAVYEMPGGYMNTVEKPYVKLISTAMLRDSILSRTKMMVGAALDMSLLILLMTAFAVANTIVAGIHARRREIGIMRSCALTRSGLLRLILGEALIIGVCAAVVSLPYGIISGLCSAQMAAINSFFGGMGWSFSVPFAAVCKGFGIAFGVCLGAALIPALYAASRPLLPLLAQRD